MNQYWEKVWNNSTIMEHMGYVYGLVDIDSQFIQSFEEHEIHNVCDAACGFGKYSALLCANGFEVSGFDIAESSLHLTRQILHFLGMDSVINNYIKADILHTPYEDNQFDAVVAHAIIDHLPKKDAKQAIQELHRIIRLDGLIYLSFSGMPPNESTHQNTSSYDGNFPLQSLDREGLLYVYYSDDNIKELLSNYHILSFHTKKNGDRDIILQKLSTNQ